MSAQAEAPLDMQEVARSAAGFLVHIDSAATNINEPSNDARAHRSERSGRSPTSRPPSITSTSLSERALTIVG